MAKIAVALEEALARRERTGEPGSLASRVLARGQGWVVDDVMCTSGPRDRSYEETHSGIVIAMVAAGSFGYRSSAGQGLMTPGSLLLGNPGESFECGHRHGSGDRCISFRYSREYFATLEIAHDFRVSRLPPVRALSALTAQACAGAGAGAHVGWEELAIELAARVAALADGTNAGTEPAPPGAEARVARVARMIERFPEERLDLGGLAREARLSPFHFLRTFERVTGLTPHQYVLRARLRDAAMRLIADGTKVLDVALDCGFGDVSNFNRAFRAEFGVGPRAYRGSMAS